MEQQIVAMPNRSSSRTQQSDLPRILVVDDDSANHEALTRILKDRYQVVCCDSGQEALTLLEREPFDTVILDIMMPHVNVLEVLKTIRSTPAIADIPVILLSARADHDDILRGLEEGANDYLIKPSSTSVIQARLHTQVMLKQLMDEHKRVIAELVETQKLRDQLFRVASHDLKAPLTNIRLTEFLLREVVGDNAEGQQMLDALMNNIDNMQGVIEKFLDVAIFQSGKVALEMQCVPIENAILDVVMEYSVAAENKNISLEVGAVPGLVLADPKRLRQILSNLVSNAVKYSPKGSLVSVWSELVDEYVRINVADHGPGIPADERHLLFQEFGKLSTRPTGQESSTGLGLWIAKHLTTLQQGDIGVDCPADGGSVFWVTLPECVMHT